MKICDFLKPYSKCIWCSYEKVFKNNLSPGAEVEASLTAALLLVIIFVFNNVYCTVYSEARLTVDILQFILLRFLLLL